MELRQLEYFAAVVEERSFTKAAKRERVAQPAVSAQIRRLERLVGQPLLTRTSRDVRLTQAGVALLPHARAALAAVRDAQAAVDEVADVVSGSVAIGTVTLHPVDVASVMAGFADHPDVEITLEPTVRTSCSPSWRTAASIWRLCRPATTRTLPAWTSWSSPTRPWKPQCPWRIRWPGGKAIPGSASPACAHLAAAGNRSALSTRHACAAA